MSAFFSYSETCLNSQTSWRWMKNVVAAREGTRNECLTNSHMKGISIGNFLCRSENWNSKGASLGWRSFWFHLYCQNSTATARDVSLQCVLPVHISRRLGAFTAGLRAWGSWRAQEIFFPLFSFYPFWPLNFLQSKLFVLPRPGILRIDIL